MKTLITISLVVAASGSLAQESGHFPSVAEFAAVRSSYDATVEEGRAAISAISADMASSFAVTAAAAGVTPAQVAAVAAAHNAAVAAAMGASTPAAAPDTSGSRP